MYETENIAIVRRFVEEIGKGNLSVIDELFSPYFISNDDAVPSDLALLKRYTAETIYAFEYTHRSSNYSAQEDLVTVYEERTFRLVNPYLDGQVFDQKLRTIKTYSVWRISNGKIVEYVKGEVLSFEEH